MGMRGSSKRVGLVSGVLSLVLCLALALQAVGTVAWAIDMDAQCSLTVIPGTTDFQEDLMEADLVLDLYKVADAVEESGSDGYGYRMLSPFDVFSIGKDITQAGWRTLATQAGELVLGSLADGGSIPGAVPVAVGVKVDNDGLMHLENGAVECGLYLLVARGSDLEDYARRITDEQGNSVLVSVADTSLYEYYFLPELVSIPDKADDGKWQYDVEVALKPQRVSRFGSVEIVKELLDYDNSEPATFVFSVEAYLEDERIYSDVVSMTFTEPGVLRKLIDRLPVGAVVTVTEVYSGSSYTLTTDATQTAVVEANSVVSVSFTNTYNHQNRHGLGINNHFEHSEESGWNWSQE